jgi:type III secretion protein V
VLSVGDGMVAQIPSLFVSIAAGIIITRVDGRMRARNPLGMQIASQVLRYPSAMLMAGIVVACFLLVPGLPTWPFLLLALALIGGGYLGRKTASDLATVDQSRIPAMARDSHRSAATAGEASAIPIAVPLRLRTSPALSASLAATAFDAALGHERAALALELGLPFPGLKLGIDTALTASQYAIDVQEMEVLQGDLDNSNVLKFAAQGTPQHGHPQPANREARLAAHVIWAVRRHADAFIGLQETHELLARAATQLPDLAAEVQKAVPLQRIADVLRRLVEEGVSIR